MKEFFGDLKLKIGILAYVVFPALMLTLPFVLLIRWIDGAVSFLKDVEWISLKEILRMVVRRESVWAVAFRGGHIELRKSKCPLRAIKTVFEKEGEVGVPEIYENRNGLMAIRYRKAPRKITIENTVHAGGKVLGTVTANQLWKTIQKVIPPGEVLKLTSVQAAKILGTRKPRD